MADLDALAGELVTALGNTSVSWLQPELLRLLADGEPITVAAIAAATSRSQADVRSGLAGMPDTEYDDEGRIVGFGITLRPTPHRFDVDGRSLFTWCALDTLMFPLLLGRSAEVTFPCHATGADVRVGVGPEPVSMKLYELESTADRQREDAVRPGPPYEIAEKKITALVGVTLQDKALERASLAAHYGLALSWSPLYLLLRRTTSLPPLVAGLGTGAAMSAIADEWMTPALGFSAPNRADPLATHMRGVAAHLVFGLGVAATTEALWAARGRRP